MLHDHSAELSDRENDLINTISMLSSQTVEIHKAASELQVLIADAQRMSARQVDELAPGTTVVDR
jgi:hypothetical protein